MMALTFRKMAEAAMALNKPRKKTAESAAFRMQIFHTFNVQNCRIFYNSDQPRIWKHKGISRKHLQEAFFQRDGNGFLPAFLSMQNGSQLSSMS